MSISPRNEARELQRLPCFKYYNLLKQESRFTVGLTPPKLPIISKNVSNRSCRKLNFVQKTQCTHMSISPGSGAREHQRWPYFKYYSVLHKYVRIMVSVLSVVTQCCHISLFGLL